MDYKHYLIEKNIKVKVAMKRINTIQPKILFVVDKNNKLLGALTDGDIRRYLMSNGSIEDSVYEACNKKPKRIAKTKKEAVGMLNKEYVAIPIVDNKKNIIDVYIGKTVEIKKQIKVPVVINAGGKGSRLEPFTKILPKPLIPVGDLPIIEHIMNKYQEYGCKDFYIIVNYKKQLIKTYFKEIERKYKINWVDEKEPLGTGGGLSLMKNKINEPFFFISCDSLILADYSDILSFHKKNKNDITMVCAKKIVTIPYGIVNSDENNQLISFEEKPEYHISTNTAMYLLQPELLKQMKSKQKMDFPDFIKELSKKGKRIGIYTIDEDKWLDMGQFSELEKMRIKLYGE